MIPVTKPFKTPLSELNSHLKDIWKSGIFTNNGSKVQQLENELKNYLDVPDLLFLTNGTISLQLAIKALDLKGEIITTPFSYVATTSSIIWEGCTPVFVDICKETLNIDPKLIEDQITPQTSAILATHVFGNPCDIDAIDIIAKKYNLKVIYDGAHAFGVKYKGESIFKFGDITTCSTHATKLFHTVEGGFIVSKNKELIKKIALMRNFGHEDVYDFALSGINGKNSEIHASVGIVNLNYLNNIIFKRKNITIQYSNLLKPLEENKSLIIKQSNNYSYYPIVINDKEKINQIIVDLENREIMTRRYFRPSLDTLGFLSNQSVCKVSREICDSILCLPIYYSLSSSAINSICKVIKSHLK